MIKKTTKSYYNISLKAEMLNCRSKHYLTVEYIFLTLNA